VDPRIDIHEDADGDFAIGTDTVLPGTIAIDRTTRPPGRLRGPGSRNGLSPVPILQDEMNDRLRIRPG
jgi:hypothetical protein